MTFNSQSEMFMTSAPGRGKERGKEVSTAKKNELIVAKKLRFAFLLLSCKINFWLKLSVANNCILTNQEIKIIY